MGNPGEDYIHSRHNVGFHCITYLAQKQGISLKQWRCHSRIGTGRISNDEVILAKPHTFMNRSGEAVKPLVWKYNILQDDLLVIYDDMDLPLGKIRLGVKGSAGGHKGLESIITYLETQQFPRLRIGIGHPPEDAPDAISHVLGRFTTDEEIVIKDIYALATEAVLCLIEEGIVSAMNKFNH